MFRLDRLSGAEDVALMIIIEAMMMITTGTDGKFLALTTCCLICPKQLLIVLFKG